MGGQNGRPGEGAEGGVRVKGGRRSGGWGWSGGWDGEEGGDRVKGWGHALFSHRRQALSEESRCYHYHTGHMSGSGFTTCHTLHITVTVLNKAYIEC